MDSHPIVPHIAEQKVGAVVVTYNPDSGFLGRLADIAAQVDFIVIVDNGSGSTAKAEFDLVQTHEHMALIRNADNRGIATALNQGADFLLRAGFLWAITFDQDSRPSPNMVMQLFVTLRNQAEVDRIALVGPNVCDEAIPELFQKWLQPCKFVPFLFKRVSCEREDLIDTTMVITSGALTNLTVLKKMGYFREDFFIDYVDIEYCLRVKQQGYRIIVSCKAKLLHNLGARKIISVLGLPFTPTFHSPLRRYYICRNRVAMIQKYGFTYPHWLLFDLIAAGRDPIRILLCEDLRLAKLSACMKGTWDGLRGYFGPWANHK